MELWREAGCEVDSTIRPLFRRCRFPAGNTCRFAVVPVPPWRPGRVTAPRFTCEPAPEAFAAALRRTLDDDAVAVDGLTAAETYTPALCLGRLLKLYEAVGK